MALILKDNQALQRLTGTAEKAKMDLSSLTQTNIRMVEVIWRGPQLVIIFFGVGTHGWFSLMEHTAVLVDEMMSLGSNLMDVNVALIKQIKEVTQHFNAGEDLLNKNTWLVQSNGAHTVLVDEMMSLGSNLMDVNVALIKVHNHWLLSSDGESEMLQSRVIVII
ncbi:hypothetical protein Syun_014597 [Stephania yunnanensis]|uniref:Uncharacterized protein n=1 Tax=Stephania yunnanensis TaxID=152371 RepID=A0AAP0JJV4_9MAGN